MLALRTAIAAPSQPCSPEITTELLRLVGHHVVVSEGCACEIVDVAGEGRPIVGVVERRGVELWIVPADGAGCVARSEVSPRPLRLVGPLAHPRLAGPGHKIWLLGPVAGDTIRPTRLGILRVRSRIPASTLP